MKILFLFLITSLTNIVYAAINTQYPGTTPNGSTPAEVETRDQYFYIPQTPLNQEALEAKAAAKKSGQ